VVISVLICKIIGQAISTAKDVRLEGCRLLVVGRVKLPSGQLLDEFVAVDNVGAGEGEVVGVIQGAPAQNALDVQGVPIDAVIVSIFDSLNIEGEEIYKK
jgi:microcompartment protein CcmK/EutM